MQNYQTLFHIHFTAMAWHNEENVLWAVTQCFDHLLVRCLREFYSYCNVTKIVQPLDLGNT